MLQFISIKLPYWWELYSAKLCQMCATTSRPQPAHLFMISHNLSGLPLGFQQVPRIAKEWLGRPLSLSWWAPSSSLSMRQHLLCTSTCHHIRIIWVSCGPKKNSMFCLLFTSKVPNFSARCKENNLVRLGPTWANGPGIFRSAKFGVLWSLLSQWDLDIFHEDLIEDLHDVPYGPFQALHRLVGLQVARRISHWCCPARGALEAVVYVMLPIVAPMPNWS